MQFIPKRRREARIQDVESLETRSLLSGVPLATLADSDPADTLDQAFQLGVLTAAEVSGSIDANGTDVDWFAFTLQFPSTVTLNGSGGTFSLYNSIADTTSDPLGSVGYRLLDQATSDGSDPTSLSRNLATGTYYVAVSGAGNYYFHPLIAHSGLPGLSGDYTLDLNSTVIDTSSSPDPLALAVDASALGFRIDLADALDFTPTVQILTAGGAPVSVVSVQQNVEQRELVVVPEVPLSSGHYSAVVKDSSGNVRLTVEFDVPVGLGSETVGGNETSATAEDLGNIADAGLIQIPGIIGDDPYYRLGNPSRAHFAGNDVDLYHFHIDSTTTVGLQAEVFAGRIGSALDAGLTLYRLNPLTGSLELVGGDNDSSNTVTLADGTSPLATDPVLVVGLTAGDYYLAVSHGLNAVSPLEGQASGLATGLLDPEHPHGAANGLDVGAYVLNVQVVPLGAAPEVVNVSIGDNEELPEAPTEVTVRFSQYMNLTPEAFASYQLNAQSTVPGVYITDSQGQKYFPSLKNFDIETFEASFLMLRRLPAGEYDLHLSGKLGVTDLDGNPLVGNTPGGDYVVHFTVDATPVGTNGDPQVWTHDPNGDNADSPQDLGTLFPRELFDGIEIVRPKSHSVRKSADFSDAYQFEILQNRTYGFQLSGLLTAALHLTLTDQSGNLLDVASIADGKILFAQLSAGVYTLHISTLSGIPIPVLSYLVTMKQIGVLDNAPPLTSGPAPTVGMRLAGMSDPVSGSNSGSGSSGSGSSGTTGGNSRPGTISSGGSVSGPVLNSNSPGYFSLRNSLSRIDLTGGSQNVVIAIPTVTTQTGSTPVFRAARTGRLGSGLRDAMAPSGLSDLADGPVGRLRSGGGLLDNSAANGRSLQALIRSSLSNQSNIAADDASNSGDKQASNASDPRLDSTIDPTATDTVTANDASDEDANQSAARNSTDQDAGFLLDAISMNLDAQHSTNGDRTDGPLTYSAEDSTSIDSLAASERMDRESDSSSTTDKLFAAGLGLLLSDLILPRSSSSAAVRTAIKGLERTNSRRGTKPSLLREDSRA